MRGQPRRHRKRRRPKAEWRGRDEDGKHGGPAVVAATARRNNPFAAVMDPNAHLTALHAALLPRTALLFLWHSDSLDVRVGRSPGGVPS